MYQSELFFSFIQLLYTMRRWQLLVAACCLLPLVATVHIEKRGGGGRLDQHPVVLACLARPEACHDM